MQDDDTKMNDFIKESTNVTHKTSDDFWFNFKNQRKHVWNLAKELKVNDETLTDDECIEQAQEFVQKFYNTIFKR